MNSCSSPSLPDSSGSAAPLGDISSGTLRALVKTHGYEAALNRLYDAILAHPRHAAFIAAVNAASPTTPAVKPILAIVPGALYREYPQTGADGRRFIDIVHTLGYETVTIPIKSLGSLDENSAIITRFLHRWTRPPLILISFSKGGADVKIALASANLEPFTKVRAWISVGGILHGTPLIQWLRRRRLRFLLVRAMLRWKGHSFAPLAELAHGPHTRLDAPLAAPPHLPIIHLISFPTPKDLNTPLARRAFHRLLPLGPNDGGGLLLADLHRLPGSIYPLLHTDHYLRNCPALPRLLSQILNLLST